jgi:hypothetical protein
MSLRGTPMQRLMATNSAVGAFALAAGRALFTSLPNFIGMGTQKSRLRSLEILPFGTGNDNTTFAYRVWRVKFSDGATLGGSGRPVAVHLDLLGSGVATLSAASLATNDELATSPERLADTLTWAIATSSTTPKGLGDTLETVHGVDAAAYSPADDTPARLVIPDCFDADGIVFETDLTGATGANALWCAYA